jgi:uncharacterized delta-60 repeat protein
MCNLPALRLLTAFLKSKPYFLAGFLAAFAMSSAVFAQPDTRAGVLQFTSSTYKIAEGDTDVITVTRSSFTGKVLVDVIVTNLTATNTDYTIASATNGIVTLAFKDSQSAASFSVAVKDNTTTTNAPKTVGFQLANVRLAPDEPDLTLVPTNSGSLSKATLTLLDNDATNSINFQHSHYFTSPGSTIQVAVILTKATKDGDEPVSVDYATMALSPPAPTAGSDVAKDGSDYAGTSGTLTFENGQTTQFISIDISTNNTLTFNKDFKITLTNPQGATIENAGETNELKTAFVLGSVSETVITIQFQGGGPGLQPAGSVDLTFNANNSPTTVPAFNQLPGANRPVNALAIQPDGKVVLGGEFTAYNATNSPGLVRVLTNGLADASFAVGSGADKPVTAIAVYTNGVAKGKIVVAGAFTSINGTQRNSVALLNPDGTLDTKFNPGTGANGPVYALALQADGTIILGGDFTVFNNTPRQNLVRLFQDGQVDTTFDPGAGPDGPILAIATAFPLPVTVGFTNANGKPVTETLTNLASSANGQVRLSFTFRDDADELKVLQGNTLIYTTGQTNTASYVTNDDSTITTNYVTRTVTFPFGTNSSTQLRFVVNEGNTNDSADFAYSAQITSLATVGFWVGGSFSTYQGQEAGNVAQLLIDGSLNTQSQTGIGADGAVSAIVIDPLVRPILAGAFTTFNSLPAKGVVRLTKEGAVDSTFSSGKGPNDAVFALALQTDGKLLIGGAFTSYNETRRRGAARLYPDGSLDTTFLDTAYNEFAGLVDPSGGSNVGLVNAIAEGASGDVFIGGFFSRVGGSSTRTDVHPRSNFARLFGGQTRGPGNISFIGSTFGGDENGGTLSVSVRRQNGDFGSGQVLVVTRDGTAVSPADYGATNVFLKWPATDGVSGQTNTIVVAVPIVNDSIIEGDEAFGVSASLPLATLNLGGQFIPAGLALGTPSTALAFIIDDDTPVSVVDFSTNSFSIDEGAGKIDITVTRSGNSSRTVSVHYSTEDGSGGAAAKAGTNYTSKSGSITFRAEQTTATFSIPIIDNSTVDPDKNFVIRLTGPTDGAQLGTNSTAGITIIDNDYAPGHVSFASTNFVTGETGSAVISVKRAGGNAGVLTVQYSTADGSATTPNDYVQAAGTLSWNDGESSVKTFTVPIQADGLVEGNEAFSVNLSNANPAESLGSPATAVVTIVDDDFFGELSFNGPVYLADENGGTVGLTVVRRQGSAEGVSVDYATVPTGTGGTNAVLGTDYQAAQGTLTFGPGETAKTIFIPLIDDQVADGEKTFQVRLSNPFNGKLAANGVTNALVRIIDNEAFNIPAGSTDDAFGGPTGPNKAVNALAISTNGSIYIGGEFTFVDGSGRSGIARLTPNGAIDPSFAPLGGANGVVNALLRQSNDRILIAGLFTTANGKVFNHIARLTASGDLDTTFNPGAAADNPVNALAETFAGADRRILIGGSFSVFNGVPSRSIARLLDDGSVDQTFKPGSGANGTVNAIVVQRDGKILIGGDFTAINGVPRNFVGRLNADGSVDKSFDAGFGADGSVRTIAIQADDRILIGGTFKSVSGVAVGSIARLNSDGTLDSTFNSGTGFDGPVYSISIQTDDKSIIVGDFVAYNALRENRIVRLNQDGTIDTTINFGTGADRFIAAVGVQPDRKIVIGGGFTEFNGQKKNFIARIFGGALAGSGAVEFTAANISVVESETNSIVSVRRVGGLSGAVTVDYATHSGSADAGADYLDVSGTLTFAPGENFKTFQIPIIDDLLAESDETVLLSLTNAVGVSAISRQPVATLTIISDDSVVQFSDASYSVNENAVGGHAVITVSRIGQSFEPVTVGYQASSGTADSSDFTPVSGTLTFSPNQTNASFNVQITDDSTVENNENIRLQLFGITGPAQLGRAAATLVIFDNDFAPGVLNFGSSSLSVNEGSGNATLTVLRTSGSRGAVSVDYVATPGTASAGADFQAVRGTLAFSDGQTAQSILIPINDDTLVEGNENFTVTLSNPAGGALLGPIINLLVTIIDDDLGPGSFDQTFNFSSDGSVYALKIMPDDKILAGGTFTQLSGVSSARIGRLNEDGSFDNTFSVGAGANGTVRALEAATNGSIVLGGEFSTVRGLARSYVARLLTNGVVDTSFIQSAGLNGVVRAVGVQNDGKIVVGGDFTAPVRGIVRLTAGGSLDIGFDPTSGTDGSVQAIAIQSDNKILMGGTFTKVGTIPRQNLARLNSNGTVDLDFKSIAANGSVLALTVQKDGKSLVAGNFTSIGGTPRARIARLETTGAVDLTFNPGGAANGAIDAIAIQRDGKIYIAGDFTQIGAAIRNHIARLNSDGSLDLTFDPGRGSDGSILAAGVQQNGKVIIGGTFQSVNGFSSLGLARLNGDPATPPVLVTFRSIVVSKTGQVEVTFDAAAGQSYQLEATSDFNVWTPVGAPVSATGSSTQVIDTSSPGTSSRFYRIHQI